MHSDPEGIQLSPVMQGSAAVSSLAYHRTVSCPIDSKDSTVDNKTAHPLINPQSQSPPSIGGCSEPVADDMTEGNFLERESTESVNAMLYSPTHIPDDVSEEKAQCTKNVTKITPSFNVSSVFIQYVVWDLAISPQAILDLIWYTFNVVLPVTSVVGIISCVISLFVLTRSGLRRPSNILLFLLSLSDIFTLQQQIGIAHLMEIILRRDHIPSSVTFFFSALTFVDTLLAAISNKASTFIILWITAERLLAVFLPLEFKSLVTARRVWSLGAATFMVPSALLIYSNIVHLKNATEFFQNNKGGQLLELWLDKDVETRAYILNTFIYILPLFLVFLGCGIIAVKLSVTRHRRRLLSLVSENNKSRNRTTKTLLLVCTSFFITRFLIVYDYFTPVGHDKKNRLIAGIVAVFRFIAMSLGTALDSAVFIFYNSKFRAIFLQMFSWDARIPKQRVRRLLLR